MIDSQQSTDDEQPRTGHVSAPTQVTRSQEEIAARTAALRERQGLFEFGPEVLMSYLDAEHFKQFAKPDADLSDWTADDPSKLGDEAEGYLAFAFGKALDHRGISAIRSVQKMREFAWLAGRDEVVQEIDAADHAQYGMPALLAYAKAFGSPVPDDPRIARMGAGDPCTDECVEGCGT